EERRAAPAWAARGRRFSSAACVVTSRRGMEGEEVHPGMDDLFQIAADLTNLRVIAEPPPSQIGQIRPGQPALITIADMPAEPLSGVVKSAEYGRVTID